MVEAMVALVRADHLLRQQGQCSLQVGRQPHLQAWSLAWRRHRRVLIGLAVERALQARQSVGGYALLVEAKGEEAKSFYCRYGFRPYLDTPNSLYLPLGGQGRPS